ncbi:hypothetical protein [Mycobacterium sp.]|uniref:hypothetical protein n=1 Tax=Mycobacterium sp. TaxID=1785 RepID=UPI003F9AC74B
MSATQKPSKEGADAEREEQHHDLTMRWGTALAERLQRVARYSSLGLLSQADERRFQALCEELHTLSALIDQFELTQQVGDSG